jgi:peptidoglycan/LPS O-acetylase OafA/YrhL
MIIRQTGLEMTAASTDRLGERALVAGLLVFGLPSLLLGLAMAFAPAAFFEFVGPYGIRNDHYIRDTASFQIALALLLLFAVRLRPWRTPALVANAVQWGLHTISHLIDVENGDPTWIGYFDLLALTAGTTLLFLLSIAAHRQESGEGAS